MHVITCVTKMRKEFVDGDRVVQCMQRIVQQTTNLAINACELQCRWLLHTKGTEESRHYVPCTMCAATTCLGNGHITEELEPKSWERVCGEHFVSGWPSDDPKYVDYRPCRPTLLMKDEASRDKSYNHITRRNERASKRTERRYVREVSVQRYCALLMS